MPLAPHDQKKVSDFFAAIAPWQDAYANATFSYIAFRQNDQFILGQGIVSLNTGSAPSTSHFRSENILAGRFFLSELKMDYRQTVEHLVSGKIVTPTDRFYFPAGQVGTHAAAYFDFHPVGIQNQNRLNVLNLTGASQMQFVRQPLFDWELKAASPPYDGIQELMFEYGLGVFRGDLSTVEVIAFNVAVVDFASPVSGAKATPMLRLANGLNVDDVSLGIRVFSRGRVVDRLRFEGNKLQWKQEAQHQSGSIDIEIPQGAVLHCIASYAGVAQHFGWLSDPSTVQNARRTVYEAFDSKLETLKDIVSHTQGRGIVARDLESAVSWLLWMLGFSVAHLGGTRRTQEAIDLVAVAPSGHFAVVECTTGLLKAENKLSLLHDRAQAARRALDISDGKHLRIIPVIVTSKTKEEVRPDLEQAEKLGVLVLTREDLDQAINRTLVLPNADELLEQAYQAVRAAQAKHELQASLPLNSLSGLSP